MAYLLSFAAIFSILNSITKWKHYCNEDHTSHRKRRHFCILFQSIQNGMLQLIAPCHSVIAWKPTVVMMPTYFVVLGGVSGFRNVKHAGPIYDKVGLDVSRFSVIHAPRKYEITCGDRVCFVSLMMCLWEAVKCVFLISRRESPERDQDILQRGRICW